MLVVFLSNIFFRIHHGYCDPDDIMIVMIMTIIMVVMIMTIIMVVMIMTIILYSNLSS